MIIEKEKPWLLWPSKSSHGISKGDIQNVLEGHDDFTFSMRIKVLSKEPNKRTIFSKLPNYMGIDVENENNNILFICTIRKGDVVEPKYIFLNDTLGWDWNFISIKYSKKYNLIVLDVNGSILHELQLKEDESIESFDDSHFIFGAGNFPHNGFNLNYSEFDVDFLCISKEYLEQDDIETLYKSESTDNKNVIGLYNFSKKTDYQIFDLTNNYNLIHRMLDSTSYLKE